MKKTARHHIDPRSFARENVREVRIAENLPGKPFAGKLKPLRKPSAGAMRAARRIFAPVTGSGSRVFDSILTKAFIETAATIIDEEMSR